MMVQFGGRLTGIEVQHGRVAEGGRGGRGRRGRRGRRILARMDKQDKMSRARGMAVVMRNFALP
eukprot:750399-Hanusia_phi.AAC.6